MMVADTPALERVLRHDRLIVVGGLAGVVVLSWIYILAGAGMNIEAGVGNSGMMEMQTAWTPAYFGLMVVMWWVMMMAMMLPSSAPMVLLFAAVNGAGAVAVVNSTFKRNQTSRIWLFRGQAAGR